MFLAKRRGRGGQQSLRQVGRESCKDATVCRDGNTFSGVEGAEFVVNGTLDMRFVYFCFNVSTRSTVLTIALQQCVTELGVVLLLL